MMVKTEILGGNAFPDTKTLKVWINPYAIKGLTYDIVNDTHIVEFTDGSLSVINKESWLKLRGDINTDEGNGDS